MEIKELSVVELDVIKRTIESKMEMLNHAFLEYDSVQKAYVQYKMPLIFDFERKKKNLRELFDKLSIQLNIILEEIDFKIQSKINVDFSFQKDLMDDFKNIQEFKDNLTNSLQKN